MEIAPARAAAPAGNQFCLGNRDLWRSERYHGLFKAIKSRFSRGRRFSTLLMRGRAGFLLIFAAVNAANVRLHHQTLSRRWISILGVAGCLVALGVLVCQTAASAPREILVLVLMVGLAFLIEAVYRASTGRAIKCPLRSRETETS